MGGICPINIIDYKGFYEGTIWESSIGDKFQIIEYVNNDKVKIKFLDNFGYECYTYLSSIKGGNVKNPYHACYETIANLDNIKSGAVKDPFVRNRYGGYMGVGPYNSSKHNLAYKSWDNMMKVAFDNDNISVSEEWKNFQVFTEWYLNYKSLLNPDCEYELNRYVYNWGKQNILYSPETCCIVSKELNRLMRGLDFGFSQRKITDPTRKQRVIDLAYRDYNNGSLLEDVYNKILTLDI